MAALLCALDLHLCSLLAEGGTQGHPLLEARRLAEAHLTTWLCLLGE